MKNLIDIYKEIDNNNVMLYDYKIGNRKSAIVHTENITAIAKNPLLLKNDAEEKTVLMHELGHYYTGSYYNCDTGYAAKQRKEYRADRWAIMNYLPIDDLLDAVKKGYTQTYELAEYFDVTEEFIHTAYDIYKRQGKLI